MDGPDGRELLDVDAVASYLGVRPTTVYEWCREGRLPCLKLGKVWRIRRAALDDFLRAQERGGGLVARLRAFLTVPDDVLAVAEDLELLHRLDAAFFQVGEARDGFLVKFCGGEPLAVDELRAALSRHGLAVPTLEAAGRLRFVPERDPLAGRAAALRALLADQARAGRVIWASFDWAQAVGLEEALRQQPELAAIVGEGALVVKTAVLERVADDWPPPARRRARAAHAGLIELWSGGLSLSRRVPVPAR